jgi:lipoprotein-releasing system ATP-binding protein
VAIEGRATSGLRDAERTRLRRARIGFVYQLHHLLADFTAAENVVLPQLLAGVARGSAEARARALLDRLGLGARADHRPGRLSGGEQQRVAIARALANRPALLLADEPTGNLDPRTAAEVLDLLLEVVREAGTAVLLVTHDPELARRTDRVWRLVEGRLEPAAG